jgi:hypothetical protein
MNLEPAQSALPSEIGVRCVGEWVQPLTAGRIFLVLAHHEPDAAAAASQHRTYRFPPYQLARQMDSFVFRRFHHQFRSSSDDNNDSETSIKCL